MSILARCCKKSSGSYGTVERQLNIFPSHNCHTIVTSGSTTDLLVPSCRPLSLRAIPHRELPMVLILSACLLQQRHPLRLGITAAAGDGETGKVHLSTIVKRSASGHLSGGVHPKMGQSVKLQLFGPPILARIQPVVDSPAMNVTVFDYRAYR